MKLFFNLPGKTYSRTRQKLLAAGFAFLLAHTAAAQTVRTATNASQLHAAIAASNPGDTIIMTNGTWTNVTINFNATATAAQPVVLRAQSPGKVILNGSSSLIFSAPHLIVNGLYFSGGALSGGAIVRFNSTNCRLTNTAIVNYNPPSVATSYYWVYFDNSYNRVDNCFFKGKNHHQPAIGNDASGSRYNTVDHCYFKDMGGSGNGSEIFRIWGYGGNEELGTDGAFFTIEYNLFDAADGEGLEMISLKSNRNNVRYNTIKNTKGEITLRSGNFNTIEGNFIFGGNKDGSRGIRLTGQYHKIINNYIENVAEDGIVVYTGEYIDTFLTPN
jgi:poly(beta-D-mannuronate) lyase